MLIASSFQFAKTMFEKLLLSRDGIIPETVDMFSKLWQYRICYLFAGYLFKDHNLVFCLLYMIRENFT